MNNKRSVKKMDTGLLTDYFSFGTIHTAQHSTAQHSTAQHSTAQLKVYLYHTELSHVTG